MKDLEHLFFELIRVAIGTQPCLTRKPSASEWKKLYIMAKKQALVGVCFAGVQRLKKADEANGTCVTVNLPETGYIKWMGMAAKIQRNNEKVNKQCVELQEMLAADGLCSCILKGQGVSLLYAEHLRGLRQPGDIDVWVQNKCIEELVEYVKDSEVTYKATAAHVECQLFEDTDVELHAEPAFMRCFWNNRKLVQWFNLSKVSIVKNELGFCVPTADFNIVYMMVHMYHHVLFEGLGLRQLMDYYFVLRNTNAHGFSTNYPIIFSRFDMLKFAKGIMWIMKEVFALEDRFLICEANEKYGNLILTDVMTGGNFGHHDEKNKNLHGGTAVGRSMNGLKRNMKFFALGPWEVLCSPLWSTWHWCWRKRKSLL